MLLHNHQVWQAEINCENRYNHIVQNWGLMYKPEETEMDKLMVIYLYELDNHLERSKAGE